MELIVEEKEIKSYTQEVDYLKDCLLATVGSLIDNKYYSKNFEEIIGAEHPAQLVYSTYLRELKSTQDKETNAQYLTEETLSRKLLETNPNLNIDYLAPYIEVLFNTIKAPKETIKSQLVEPSALYDKLFLARKKLDLFRYLRTVSEKEELKTQNPVTWTNKFCDKLIEALDTSTDKFQHSESDEAKLLAGQDLINAYKEFIKERVEGTGKYSFHYKIFDELVTEGPTPGHGGIIGGSTGMGKSTLCLNVINGLLEADVPVMYFPIEMGLENTLDRLAAVRTHIPYKTIMKMEKDSETQQLVQKEMECLKLHDRFAIINDPVITLKKLRNYIQNFQAKIGRKYCIVFIDLLLQIQEFLGDEGNPVFNIERAVTNLDILAKELGVHWVGVVQLNKSIESDKVVSVQSIDKLKPTRSSIKNSSALLERARYSITLFRKKPYAELYLTPEEAATVDDIAEIQLLKANNEEIQRRYALFDGPTFCVSPYEMGGNGF